MPDFLLAHSDSRENRLSDTANDNVHCYQFRTFYLTMTSLNLSNAINGRTSPTFRTDHADYFPHLRDHILGKRFVSHLTVI